MEKRIKYVLFALLVTSLIKSLIMGSGINEVLLIGILAGLTAFYEASFNNKQVTRLQIQIDELIKHNKEQDKSIDDVKNSIVSVKVSSGMRSLTNK